jgi:peptide/nickel transport system substrate-binding protein
VTGAIALGVTMTACTSTSSSSKTSAPAAPQNMSIAFSQEVTDLNPYGTSDVQTPLQLIGTQIFDTLVKENPKTKKFEPSLATKWSQPDPLTWEFTLRKANFSDGTPVTASDVAADLTHLAGDATPLSSLWASLNTVTAVNDKTVKITTKTPLGTMLSNLALLFITPASDITKPDFATNPIGSGPFTVTSFAPQSKVVLTANKDYWGGKPKLSTLTIKDIPDESARLTALKNNEVQAVWVVSPDQVPTLKSDTGIKVINAPSAAYFFLWFNASQKPFDDKRVRQAMWYAVDTKAVTKNLYGAAGSPMTSPIPSTVFGSSVEKPYTYDPKKAKQLLAEAGYPNGFSTSVIIAADSAPLIQEQAQAYVSYWAKVGVKVTINSQATAVWLQNLLALNWQMDLQENINVTGDADYTLNRLYTTKANRTGYHNADLDAILSEASQSTDQAKRKELYAQANKIIWDDAVGMFPIQENDTYALSDKVKGFEPVPSRSVSFLNVSLGN